MKQATTVKIDRPDSIEARLWNVAEATKDGLVRGHVTDCSETDEGELAVKVRLPNGEVHVETFVFPQADTPEYAFVRLVEDCGYSLGSVEHLAGEGVDGAEVWCEPIEDTDTDSEADSASGSDDDWRIVVPEYTPGMGERVRGQAAALDTQAVVMTLAVGGGFVVFPLIAPLILFQLAAEDDGEDVFGFVIFGSILLMMWGLLAYSVYALAFGPTGLALDIALRG
jgi:hypothetical protein